MEQKISLRLHKDNVILENGLQYFEGRGQGFENGCPLTWNKS